MTKSLFSRRRFLGYGMVAALAGYASKVWAKPVFSASPFTLGVASGYPEPNGVCLWTRLAPEFLAPAGGMPPEAVAVSFEIAEDQAFKSIVDQGQAWAEPIFAHSVHLETTKLAQVETIGIGFMWQTLQARLDIHARHQQSTNRLISFASPLPHVSNMNMASMVPIDI